MPEGYWSVVVVCVSLLLTTPHNHTHTHTHTHTQPPTTHPLTLSLMYEYISVASAVLGWLDPAALPPEWGVDLLTSLGSLTFNSLHFGILHTHSPNCHVHPLAYTKEHVYTAYFTMKQPEHAAFNIHVANVLMYLNNMELMSR